MGTVCSCGCQPPVDTYLPSTGIVHDEHAGSILPAAEEAAHDALKGGESSMACKEYSGHAVENDLAPELIQHPPHADLPLRENTTMAELEVNTQVSKEVPGNEDLPLRENITMAELEVNTQVSKEVPGNEAFLELTFEFPKDTSLATKLGMTDTTVVVNECSLASPLHRTVDGGVGVRHGDTIISVSGARGDTKIILQALNQAKLTGGIQTLVVKPRPATFNVEVKRIDEQRLGLRLNTDEPGLGGIEIGQDILLGGAIDAWNQANPPLQVVMGDVIVTVNDLLATPHAMLEELTSSWKERRMVRFAVQSRPTVEERRASATMK